MKYPLKEKIGDPDLLVGREKEFRQINQWIDNIPRMLSRSRVIIARRKSGKTSFVQRIFNRLWSENGPVTPFYLAIPESKIWHPTFAITYYRAFASQYISFLERDETPVRKHLSLEEIREYGLSKSIQPFVSDVDLLSREKKAGGLHDLMWETACSAPHVFAALYNRRILVIIDEFQNITRFIHRDERCEGEPDETLAGSFHSAVESKIAPMLVTGPPVQWPIGGNDVCPGAARFSEYRMKPNLTPLEGLLAVYQYAAFYKASITNKTAILINQLCMADPFFIASVIQNPYGNGILTTEEGVVNAIHHEIANRRSDMSRIWRDSMCKTLRAIDDRNGRAILLHLAKHPDRSWTPKEIQEAAPMELDERGIQEKLRILAEAEAIEWGESDIRFRGPRDGALNLILRNRLEEEISGVLPDLKQELHDRIKQFKAKKRGLQGLIANLSGKFAEFQLGAAFRSRKSFSPSDYFTGVKDETELNIIDVRQGVLFQRDDGKKMKFDVIAESDCGRVLVVEVKKRNVETGPKIVSDFHEKVNVYAKLFPDKTILPAFLSMGGFTVDAGAFCKAWGIGAAEKIEHY
ncbi:MAG: hypothetical protein GY859_02155 [Desulfobacterales bacterium]|nr:hypothetical protein [Desulfobacterales bacterium]